MDKQAVKDYFDQAAAHWDQHLIHDDAKINRILDYADIGPGQRILDVGCGTGVLIPDYLARGVREIVGADISPRMIEAASRKFQNDRVTFLCCDVEQLGFQLPFDRVVVYNAFPHFPDPAALIDALAGYLKPGGRLTVAHGMSRAKIDAHHAGRASAVSNGLMSEKQLAELMTRHGFAADVRISDEEIFVVSGLKRAQ